MRNGHDQPEETPWRGIDMAWIEQHLPRRLISELRSMLSAAPPELADDLLLDAVATASIVSPGVHSPDFPYRLAASAMADAGKEPRDLGTFQSLGFGR